MTLDELKNKYFGHWVGVKVLSRDNAGQPENVELVAMDVDMLSGKNLLKSGEEYCILYLGNIPECNLTVMY